ncbi:ABC transporter permease [Cohnella hashimotonis]|uniref:ABC-2 family transporter protein n=1 Tax=Cohnella hashimotonis TaxID=2826895 RepID=A0ABT6TMV7_9BACL|nr:ABC-2 family transporter protein [Cohnella hashimotonis]MDI4647259.1 ABC-2 family transporter protein [Cohnella hashimotonis]
MSPYLYAAKLKLLVSLAYRFEVFAALGTNVIVLLANLYLWKAAYRGIDSVAGVTEDGMIVYAMMSVLLTSFFPKTVEEKLQERIGQGDIAVDFFRPVRLVLMYFFEDVGTALGAVATQLAPLLLVMALFLQNPLPVSLAAFLLFLVSACLSFVLLWLISLMLGLLCFWVLQLGNLGTVKDGVLLLLSGRFIPLWLFPEEARSVLVFLPFSYIYQTPLGIYIGQLAPGRIAFELLVQAGWIVALSLAAAAMWSRARKRVLVQGG